MSYQLLDLEQGSQEWLAFRQEHIGSSDAPIIDGRSPWKTPYQLYQEKLGIVKPGPENEAMRRGKALEADARLALGAFLGVTLTPAVIQSRNIPWMISSLDGMSPDGRVVCEIKCPGEDDHSLARKGLIPEKYVPQLQHILMTMDTVDKIHYWSWRHEQGICLEFTRDVGLEQDLLVKEQDFWDCLQNFQEPELTYRDFTPRDDHDWRVHAEQYLDACEKAKEWSDKQETARRKLLALAGNENCVGSGLRVSKTFRRGSVSYNEIPELIGVDLETYRKGITEVWRINRIKDNI